MRESSTPNTEGDFVVLHQELCRGQRSVDDFLKALDFEYWLRGLCYNTKRFDFHVFEGTYGPEDLKQVCLQKVREAAPKLESANTPNRRAFFGWANTLVFRTFLDALRAYRKPQNNGFSRSYEPLEMISVQTPDVSFDVAYEQKELLRLFLRFIENYPESHQLAIQLWLQDDSYREIADALSKKGIECCYGTVRNWVIAVLDAFRVEIGLELPKPSRKRLHRRPEI